MQSKASSQPPIAVTPHLAHGVDYRAIPGAPAPSFECVRYRAQLLTTACSKRWRQAQTAKGFAADAIERCRGCPIGAQHAGEKIVRYSSLFGKDICSRCGRGSGRRLIGGTRCVSCANRQYESIKGRNRKGTRPTMAPLEKRTISYVIEGGGVEELTIQHSRDMVELMMATLRNRRGRPYFFFAGRAPVRKAEAA
jgi:hypothetical protein